jgi:predicted acetyltransferase
MPASEVRPPANDAEVDAWFEAEAVGFGGVVDAEFVAGEKTVLEADRMLGVWEDGRCIAVAGSYGFELTVPGGSFVPAAGVCDVAVLPTHRRRGHLTRMMRRLHDEARARGDSVAVLTASDGSIYPRFGYGIATTHAVWRLDARRARQIEPPELDLETDLLVGVAAAEPLAELWDRTRSVRPGTISRSVEWWRLVLGPYVGWKGGGTVFTLLLRDRSTRIRGAAAYRLAPNVDRGVQDWTVEPLDLLADDPDVEAQLWLELGRMDHVGTIAPRIRPIDDPLRWRLVDPRQLRMDSAVDLLWLCPLDVVSFLGARSYATETSVVLAIEDDFDKEVEGTYRLDTGETGAACARVDDVTPDLRLTASALGSASLGGVGLQVLAAAGRVHEERPGALAAADTAFRTPLAPFNSTFF